MIEAHTHHAFPPLKQAFDDSRWLRQTRDKRPFGIRRPLLYPAELREPAPTYGSPRMAASQSVCHRDWRSLNIVPVTDTIFVCDVFLHCSSPHRYG